MINSYCRRRSNTISKRISNTISETSVILKHMPRNLRYRVFRKKSDFFSLQTNPSLHRFKRSSKLSTQCQRVKSLLLVGNFCTTNSSRVLAIDRWQTFENFWKQHNIQSTVNTLYNMAIEV